MESTGSVLAEPTMAKAATTKMRFNVVFMAFGFLKNNPEPPSGPAA
jgi:hypothetical protein